ncbi:MAG: MYG1 family protein [Candidatus Peribacteraceae bacterium]|nr:MYG1 family protein [Candidatus Peribacteraceae bacterium]
MQKFVTHSGAFHADDVFAAALLTTIFPLAAGREIIRTRDQAIIEEHLAKEDSLVFDIGHGEFDHHQKGGNGTRVNGIPYASFGLIWNKFAAQYIELWLKSIGLQPYRELFVDIDIKRIISMVDTVLVQPVDSYDNGVDIHTNKFESISPLTISQVVFGFNAPWFIAPDDDTGMQDFLSAVAFAQKQISRTVEFVVGVISAESIVKNAIDNAEIPEIIVLDRGLPWKRSVIENSKKALFVVSDMGDTWIINTVPIDTTSKTSRRDLPKHWAGLKDKDLALVTGVDDAVFCHNNLFIAGAKSKEGALKMAELSL